MKAAPAAQARILDLQATDTAIAQLTHRRQALPEHAAIADGKAERARLVSDLVAARTRASDLQAEADKAEADLVPVRERRARDQQRLDDGVVNEAKSISVLTEEIAHLDRRISDLEDAELQAMEDLDEATAREQELSARLAELEASVRALIASRDEQVVQLDAEIAAQQQARDGMVGEIPADLLALYDRIRARSGGLAAVELAGRRCSGCQIEATPSALAGYGAAAEDDVLRCEECERILVRSHGRSA
jgi:predicted  nucleic acid-binding Zn-ribbon protein